MVVFSFVPKAVNYIYILNLGLPLAETIRVIWGLMLVKLVVVKVKWIFCQLEVMETQETWTLSELRGGDWISHMLEPWLGRSKVTLSFLNGPDSPFYFNSWDQHKVICQRKYQEVDLPSWELCCYQSCTKTIQVNPPCELWRDKRTFTIMVLRKRNLETVLHLVLL